MSPVAVILYEDNRGAEKGFGLHALVVACVADDLDVEMFTLARKLDGRPMKEVANLVRSCRRDIHRIAPQGQTVFALIDDDRIRDHLPGIDVRAGGEVVARAIKSQSDAPEQLEVFLLVKNTETVIEAAKHCDPTLPDDAVAQALAKNLAQRDRILSNVAYQGVRAVRDCIRAEQRPAQMALLVRALAAPRPVVDDASAAPLAAEAFALLNEASAVFRAAREAEALASGDDLQRVALLWTSLHGVVGNRKLARFDVAGLSPAALVSELARALLVGWGARREDVDDCLDRAARAAAREG